MADELRPLVEINQRAIALLYRELGTVDTIRFIRQFTSGFGDYTKEREDLFGNVTLEEILKEIENPRKKS
jgi:hypothetical protein